MANSISANQALHIKHQTLHLEGAWGACVGDIDRTGVVFFWGQSGNGKSSAVMSFAKALTAFGRVLYVSLEEGLGLSFQNTLRRLSMQDCGCRFQVVANESIEELSVRLAKHKSPDFVIIDSYQYTQLNYRQYIALKQQHTNKLLIFVSHADGKQPAGRAAKSVMYDAGLKIWVEGYKAFSNGRFIGSTGEFVIWPEGATRYWGSKE
ncbi:MAG: hypothetical protein RR410_04730 [Alistipes sp.]